MSKAVGGTVAAALVLAGGYFWADLHDLVPGVLTIAPETPDPKPFPTVNVPEAQPEVAQVLSALPADAPIPTAAHVSDLVKELTENSDHLGKSVAVIVTDGITGEVLGESSADKAVIPASVQKLFTAVVALDQLDPNQTLRTRVVLSGTNTLYLAGEGDMMLSAKKGNPDATNGHAGLQDLAEQVAAKLKLAGIEEVNLKLDESAFQGNPLGPWDEDLVPLGYAAPVSVVAVDTGRRSEGNYAPRYTDPALEAAKSFAARLKEQGIAVKGAVSKGVYESAGAALNATGDNLLGEVNSAPIPQIVQYFLKSSDNTITEIIGHTIARDRGLPASFSGSTTAVVQGLGKLGIDTSKIKLVDCSGLGESSYVTARSIDQVLELMVSSDSTNMIDAVNGLPIGGLSGTLNDRFIERNGRGLLRAKTGSLPEVTALAGTVVTIDNRLLTFTVIADKIPKGGQWGARKAVDTFAEKLTECGCS